MSKPTLDIRIRLTEDVKERFLQIKKSKGLTNNTEVLRLIINEYYKQVKEKLRPEEAVS